MDSAAPDRPRWSATLYALGWVSLFTDWGTEMIFPLLPAFLTVVLGAGPTALGLIEGTADTVAAGLKLGAGVLLDRWPRAKAMTTLGYGLSSALRPLVGFASAPWMVFAVRVGDRVGKGLRGTPADALLAESTPPGEAGRVFGFNRAMDNAGAVIGPLAASGLLLWTGGNYRAVFWLAALPGGLAVATLVLFVRPDPPPRARRPRAAVAAPAEPLPAVLRRYLVVAAIFGLASSSDAFLLLRATELGVAAAAVPLLWIVLNLSKMLTAYPLGAVSDRWGRRPALAIGYGWYGLSYLAFAALPSQAWLWPMFALYGVFYGLTEGVGKALVADLAPRERRGTAFGLYNGAVGFSALPAGLLTGLLWKGYGSAVALLVCAALAGLAALGLLTLRQDSKTGP